MMISTRSSAQTGPSSFQFIENKGQWEKTITFKGELNSGAFYLQRKGFTVLLHSPQDLERFIGTHTPATNTTDKKNKPVDYSKDLSGQVINKDLAKTSGKVIRSHAYTVEFTDANENPQIIPEKQVRTYNNYFIGNDPSKWVSNAKIYNAILYKNIYPNIDLRYYSEDDKLKYDLIIYPGGDPSKIVMKYTGPDKLSIKNDELLIKTSVGDVKELYPYSFQPDNAQGRKKIDCQYVLSSDNTVRFKLGQYSKNTTLVIDPSLIFVSFTGSRANQYGFTATPGPNGALFSGGLVFSEGFPTTPGAFQQNFKGGSDNQIGTDIGIMKFSPNGSQRVYATYIGGSHNEYPHSLFSDPAGNLVVMGRSYSDDYPDTRGYAYAGKACDIVVTKLNATGSALIGSLRIGGEANDGVNIEDIQQSERYDNSTSLLRNYGDDSRSEVILDAANNIYIAGQTQSSDFPVTAGAFQTGFGGRQDGVVLKIDPTCNNLIWASFLGGTGDDGAFVLDINPLTQILYVGGGTTSKDFPNAGAGPMGGAYVGGQTDAFVSQIRNDGSALMKSVYLGTANADIIYGLKFDRKGFPYVMGVSRGGQWPVKNAVFSNAGSSQFVAKLEPNLSTFDYSTVFGSGSAKPNMSPVAFLVDRCENVYISGWGGWISGSRGEKDPYDQAGVRGMPVTADAIKSSTDNEDFYFIVIQKNASKLMYGTFFGQVGGAYGEHVDGGTSRYDQQGVIYQAICANCGGGAKFPTTPGVVGPVNASGAGDRPACDLAAVKMAFNFAGVASGPRPSINGVRDSLGCAPFTVTLEDTVQNAVSYIWKFDDGSPDTTTLKATNNGSIVHTFNNVGVYKVTLIAIDTNTCNERDTAYTYVKVGSDKANLDFEIEKLEPCEQLNYQFTNNSTHSGAKPFTDSSFVWDFGDGSPLVYAGTDATTNPIIRAYAQPGTYNVKLYLVDPEYCNSPDSLVTQVFVNPLVDARFETPPAGCAPYTAIFTNTSLAGRTFEWNFGDGSAPSSDVNPTHVYNDPGVYSIHLTAIDSGTCNIIDDTTISITVSNKPTSEFSHSPIVPVQNKPTIFTNLSSGGVLYKWVFGDGDSTVKNTKDTTLHQYNQTGTYNACLITYNQFGCTDTACHEVQAEILPLLDVPNAFTPGKFGRNSVIRVEGFGIARMTWKIYNRWGQVVFETNDRRGAWDGTFNGQPQPVDVYQYTLDVQFVDGAKTRRTGDITLIR
jgi:gliding motility-associated-like protein